MFVIAAQKEVMEQAAKAAKWMPLSCAQQALVGGLGGIAPPVAADVGYVMITIL